MNKHDEAQARRALLELFVSDLESAISRRHHRIEELLRESGGAPVTPPPLDLPRMGRDTSELLCGGLRAALAGEKDPFGIAPPRGISPALERQSAIEAVAAVLGEVDNGANVEDAIAAVASRYPVSEDTLSKLYRDEDLRAWASLHRHPFPTV